MVKKVQPATALPAKTANLSATCAQPSPPSTATHQFIAGANQLLNQLPVNRQLQAIQSVIGLASEVVNCYQAHQLTQSVYAECERDKHLSDNEVRQAVIRWRELTELHDTQRKELSLAHQHRMVQLNQQHDEFNQIMDLIRKMLEDYKHKRDPQSLVMASELLTKL